MKYVETVCGTKLKTGAKIIASFGMIMCVVGFGLSIDSSMHKVCQKNDTMKSSPSTEVNTVIVTTEPVPATSSPDDVDDQVDLHKDETHNTATDEGQEHAKEVNQGQETAKEAEQGQEVGEKVEDGQQEQGASDKDRRAADPEAGKRKMSSRDDGDVDIQDILDGGNIKPSVAPPSTSTKTTSSTPSTIATTTSTTAKVDVRDKEDGAVGVEDEEHQGNSTDGETTLSPDSSPETVSTSPLTTETQEVSSKSSAGEPQSDAAPEETTTESATTTSPEDDNDRQDDEDETCLPKSTWVISMIGIFLCLFGFGANISLLHSARRSNPTLSVFWLVWAACLYCLQLALVANYSVVPNKHHLIAVHLLLLIFTVYCGYIVTSFRKKLLAGHNLAFGQELKMSKINDDDAYQQLKMEEGSYGSGDAKA